MKSVVDVGRVLGGSNKYTRTLGTLGTCITSDNKKQNFTCFVRTDEDQTPRRCSSWRQRRAGGVDLGALILLKIEAVMPKR